MTACVKGGGGVMKKTIPVIIIAASILVVSGVSPAEDDFRMKLAIMKEEVSKDSHSDTYEASIRGRDVVVLWRHEGFPGEVQERKKSRLSENAYQNLRAFIERARLNRNLKEKGETGESGLSVTIRLELTMNSRRTVLFVSGMYNRWGVPPDQRCTIANVDCYASALNILTALQNGQEDFNFPVKK